MDRFPIYRSTKKLPGVSGSVRSNVNVDTGAGKIWEAVGEAESAFGSMAIGLIKKKQAIGQKRMDMEDFNLTAASNSRREVAYSGFEVFKDNNTPNTWEGELDRINKVLEAADGEVSYNSQNTQNIQALKWKTIKEIKEDETFIASTKGIAAATIEVQGNAIITGVRAGDPVMQADAEKAYREVQKGKDPKLLDLEISELRAAGMKKRREDVILRLENIAADNPNEFKALKVKEDALRDNGKTSYPDLTGKDWESITDYADSVNDGEKQKAKAELKAKQDETAKNLLVDLWDGKLEVSQVKVATEGNLLTYEKATGLYEALTNPKAFELSSYIKVKDAVNAYERGKVDFDSALNVLVTNASSLGDEGKALTDKLFAMPNKNEGDWEREGIDYIESQILETDIFGRMYGTSEEQTAALEARLAYDKALEKAERDGTPIEGRDKLIKAHEIMIKYLPEKDKAPPVELEEELGSVPLVSMENIDKAITQAKENLGEKATPQDIKAEVLRLLR